MGRVIKQRRATFFARSADGQQFRLYYNVRYVELRARSGAEWQADQQSWETDQGFSVEPAEQPGHYSIVALGLVVISEDPDAPWGEMADCYRSPDPAGLP